MILFLFGKICSLICNVNMTQPDGLPSFEASLFGRWNPHLVIIEHALMLRRLVYGLTSFYREGAICFLRHGADAMRLLTFCTYWKWYTRSRSIKHLALDRDVTTCSAACDLSTRHTGFGLLLHVQHEAGPTDMRQSLIKSGLFKTRSNHLDTLRQPEATMEANKSGDSCKQSSDRNGTAIADPEKLQHENNKTGDPFGDESDAGVKYRTLEWWQAGIIMIAETISVGILSLPSVLATIGIVAGVILIVGLGLIATYTGYVFGQFKQAYPHVHNMADAGEVLLGSFGREVFGAAQV